jgi:hydroxymethylpyrimidine pyrophosphatase-like HAD family hydrolase
MAFLPEHVDTTLGDDEWRLVGLDIDGTLMHWGGDISEPVANAITQARMTRNHVVLATGRNILATVPVAHRLGIKRGYIVCSNGALTLKLNPAAKDGYEVVETITFDPAAVLAAIREEMPDALVAVEDLGTGFRVTRPFPMGELTGEQRVVDFDDLAAHPVTRVVIRAPGAEVSHFDNIVERLGLTDVTYAVGYTAWLDLTPPGVTKASALERIRQQLGVRPEHTVAVGDGNNDVDMLRWAARSYAMANAPEHVAAAAKARIGHVEQDGVLHVLESLIDPARVAI